MATLRTNRAQLIMQSVVGEISDPPARLNNPYRISADGEPIVAPGTGGITYNARIGDSAIDIWADHVEPAVSIKNYKTADNSSANCGLNLYACVGNRAKVLSGDAKGEVGRVTGKHGGIEHIIIDFTPEQMEKMAIGDRIQVMAYGQGLALLDFPGIKVRNLDPDLLEVMGITGNVKTGHLKIKVTHTIPSAILGSGLGHNNTFYGDYDIQMFDPPTVEEYHLNTLRFGDIVAILGADHSYGRIYRSKSISVGVVVHSRSVVAGHGPGVTTLFTSKDGLIDPVIDKKANLKEYFSKL